MSLEILPEGLTEHGILKHQTAREGGAGYREFRELLIVIDYYACRRKRLIWQLQDDCIGGFLPSTGRDNYMKILHAFGSS